MAPVHLKSDPIQPGSNPVSKLDPGWPRNPSRFLSGPSLTNSTRFLHRTQSSPASVPVSTSDSVQPHFRSGFYFRPSPVLPPVRFLSRTQSNRRPAPVSKSDQDFRFLSLMPSDLGPPWFLGCTQADPRPSCFLSRIRCRKGNTRSLKAPRGKAAEPGSKRALNLSRQRESHQLRRRDR